MVLLLGFDVHVFLSPGVFGSSHALISEGKQLSLGKMFKRGHFYLCLGILNGCKYVPKYPAQGGHEEFNLEYACL